jgi:hypothetical protein
MTESLYLYESSVLININIDTEEDLKSEKLIRPYP